MAANQILSELAEAAAAMFRTAVQETTQMFEKMKGAFAGLAGVQVAGGITGATAISTPSSGQGRGGGRGGGGIV